MDHHDKDELKFAQWWKLPQIQWQSQKRGPFKHKKTFNRQQYNVLLEIVDNYQWLAYMENIDTTPEKMLH